MKKIIYDYDGIIIQDILNVPMSRINIPIVDCVVCYNNENYVVTGRIFDFKDECLNVLLKKVKKED